jgi:UDP-N-acetylglucosamine 4-epimerase
MTVYEKVRAELVSRPRRWVVTGVAGFIGSNLLETLLGLDQTVVGLDDLSLGSRGNLEQVGSLVGPERWRRFAFLEATSAASRPAAGARGADLSCQAAIGRAALHQTRPCNAATCRGTSTCC